MTLVFPSSEGGSLWLDNWRNREWYDELDMAGISEALARLIAVSVPMDTLRATPKP